MTITVTITQHETIGEVITVACTPACSTQEIAAAIDWERSQSPSHVPAHSDYGQFRVHHPSYDYERLEAILDSTNVRWDVRLPRGNYDTVIPNQFIVRTDNRQAIRDVLTLYTLDFVE